MQACGSDRLGLVGIDALFPQMSVTAAVSPNARPSPKMIAVTIPDFAAGKIVRKIARLLRRAQRQRALVIAFRHSPQRRFRNADDRGQDHDAENKDRCQKAEPAAAETIRAPTAR